MAVLNSRLGNLGRGLPVFAHAGQTRESKLRETLGLEAGTAGAEGQGPGVRKKKQLATMKVGVYSMMAWSSGQVNYYP